MNSYADALESYLIPAEEGFMDKVKSATKWVGKTLMKILEVIKRGLLSIVKKVRALFASKNKKRESPKELAEKLSKENDELKKKIAYLEQNYADEKAEHQRDNRRAVGEFLKDDKKIEKLESKKERASNMIADLKKQVKDNEDKMQAYKESVSNANDYKRFEKVCLAFIAQSSQQINKAYTVLPKLVAYAKKYDNTTRKRELSDDDDDDMMDRSFYTKIQSDLPTMASGSWSNLYKTLKYTYLKSVQENSAYVEWRSDVGRGLEILVKQSTQTIEYLEKMVKDINANNDTSNNAAYKWIVDDITRNEGFIDMLRCTVSVCNSILDCYTKHDAMITHTVYDSI